MNRFGQTAALCAAASLALGAIACGNKGSGSSTSPTITPADPTIVEHYKGRLGVGQVGFYSYSVTQYGTVNITLTSVDGADGAPALGLGIGRPSAFDCSTAAATTTGPGTDVHLNDTDQPGVYCVRVYDVGNLTAPVNFDVLIAHP